MAKPESSDQEFLNYFEANGMAATVVHFKYGSEQAVHNRCRRIHERNSRAQLPPNRYPHRQELKIKNGTVIVFSDAHWWPKQKRSTAHAALLRTISETPNIQALIANGDIVDAASINRHPSIGWESKPTFAEEMATAGSYLHELDVALPEDAARIWNLGNHDANFETQIANMLPNMRGIHGMHLKDHFPVWTPAWSTWINGDVVIKHRYKGGDNAPANNTKSAGLTMVTGHLHSANVVAFTDYRGTRYGVDTGTLAVPYGPQFVNYTEDNPLNWRSAFGVFTFANGILLRPELVEVLDEEKRLTQFRGQVTREARS